MRATPPSRRMSAGTRSRAITAQAPASSAILACSAVTTSMMTPPFNISARPRLTGNVPVGHGAPATWTRPNSSVASEPKTAPGPVEARSLVLVLPIDLGRPTRESPPARGRPLRSSPWSVYGWRRPARPRCGRALSRIGAAVGVGQRERVGARSPRLHVPSTFWPFAYTERRSAADASGPRGCGCRRRSAGRRTASTTHVVRAATWPSVTWCGSPFWVRRHRFWAAS